MVRVLWCCYQKLDKDLTARVFYIRRNSGCHRNWMFSHRKVQLNWQSVCVFIINGFVYCSIFRY